MYTTSTGLLKLHLKRYTFSLSAGKSTSVLAEMTSSVHDFITAAPGTPESFYLDQDNDENFLSFLTQPKIGIIRHDFL